MTVTASGDASLRLIMGKRVQPINPNSSPTGKPSTRASLKVNGLTWAATSTARRISGAKPADVQHQNLPDTAGQLERGVCKQDLPDGKTNQAAQAYDGPIYIADAALFVKATQPQLGINDPYQLTEEQYAAVLKVLRDQHALIHRYWHDTTVQMSDFKNEGVVASSARPYRANALKAENQPIATVFPKEGVTGWADTTMLHAQAKHPMCATNG